jgi:hypothetical protein
VVRGEIDNRVKGIVRGKIWVDGREEPVVLELKGNACPDLAGCLLTFVNLQKRYPHQHLESLRPLQRGWIGDITASRKVRVLEVPVEEAMKMSRRKKKPPEHMANCLYVEWFSEANGRVVIESPDYQLQISAPEWRMTPEEDANRIKDATAGMDEFMAKLTEAIDEHHRGQKDPEEKWDEHDYEKFLKEADARTDKYAELLDKYGDSDEAEEKIAKEMGWDREDDEEEGDEKMTVEEMNAICEEALNEPEPEPDPLREGIDWVRTEDGDIRHPLQHRCHESAWKFNRQAKELGLEKSEDKDLTDFLFGFHTVSVKLAGALQGTARGEGFHDAAFTVAYLKRALNYLHQTCAGLEAVATRRLLPDGMITEARKELFEIREVLLRLMDELRGRN